MTPPPPEELLATDHPIRGNLWGKKFLGQGRGLISDYLSTQQVRGAMDESVTTCKSHNGTGSSDTRCYLQTRGRCWALASHPRLAVALASPGDR